MELIKKMVLTDIVLCRKINNLRGRRALDLLFKYSTLMGDGWFYLIFIPSFYFISSVVFMGIIFPLIKGFTLNLILYKFIKTSIKRVRPYVMFDDIISLVDPPDKYSFPSGHTSTAVMFSIVSSSFYPGFSVFFIVFTLLVAFSRVYNGVHYPLDIFAGFILGSISGYIGLS